MSNIETFSPPAKVQDGLLKKMHLLCEGLVEHHKKLEEDVILMCGSSGVRLEPLPAEKVPEGLPAMVEMAARYLGRCHQSENDLRKIL